MTNHISSTSLTVALAVAGALSLTTVDAQTSSTPSTTVPAGQAEYPVGSGLNTDKGRAMAPKTSHKSRATVKQKTKDAEANGTMIPAGQAEAPAGSGLNTDMGRAMAPKTSHKSRASVKEKTKDAEANGTLVPAGQAAQPVREAPKR